MRRLVTVIFMGVLLVSSYITSAAPPAHHITIDVSQPGTPQAVTIPQASAARITVELLENGDQYRDLGSTVATLKYGTNATAEAIATVTNLTEDVASGLVHIDFAPTDTGVAGAYDAWLILSRSGSPYFYGELDLTIQENTYLTDAAGTLQGSTITFLSNTTYQGTAAYGPVRAGSNVTARTLTDGSVAFDVDTSTIPSDGQGVTNVISTDTSVSVAGTTAQPDISITGFVYSALAYYATLTDLSGYVATTGGAVNGRLDVGSGADGLVLQAQMDANGESIVNVQEINGVEPASWLTAESNYSAGDVLPAVDGGAVTGLNASALSSGTVPQDRFPVVWYPAETNIISGAWVLDLRTNTYQAVQLSSNVTSWALTVADTNALVPWRVDVYGADTNTLTISTNWTVFGDAGSTWTNSAMSILGSAWRGEVSVGKELYQ